MHYVVDGQLGRQLEMKSRLTPPQRQNITKVSGSIYIYTHPYEQNTKLMQQIWDLAERQRILFARNNDHNRGINCEMNHCISPLAQLISWFELWV